MLLIALFGAGCTPQFGPPPTGVPVTVIVTVVLTPTPVPATPAPLARGGYADPGDCDPGACRVSANRHGFAGNEHKSARHPGARAFAYSGDRDARAVADSLSQHNQRWRRLRTSVHDGKAAATRAGLPDGRRNEPEDVIRAI